MLYLLLMHVVSQKSLKDFWKLYPDAEFDLRRWYLFAKKAFWLSPPDEKKVFASASFAANNRVVFNICGNKYRLVVKMAFEGRRIYIRFVGTHQQYDRIDVSVI